MVVRRAANAANSGGIKLLDRKPFFLTSPNDPDFLANSSGLGYIFHGCFDLDRTTFCASRLTDFSCMHWQDVRANVTTILRNANKNKNAKQLDLDLQRQFGPDFDDSYFRNMDNPFGAIHQFSNFSDSFLTPNPLFKVEKTKVFQSACEKIRGREHFIAPNLEKFQIISLPILLFIAFVTCIKLSSVMQRLGRHHFFVCVYGILLCWLEILLIGNRAVDLWIQTLTQSSLITTVLLSHNSFCQVYHFIFTFLSHLRALLYPVIAVDTWRLLSDPKRYYYAYTRGWVRSTLILIIVILATCNSQFLWTFGVMKRDSTYGHDEGYLCTFSIKHVHPLYRDYVWPLLDFALGDLLPILITGIYTIWGWLLHRHAMKHLPTSAIPSPLSTCPDKMQNIDRYIMNVPQFFQLSLAFLVYCGLFVLTALPQATLFLLKYSLYIRDKWRDHAGTELGILLVNQVARETRKQERRAQRYILEPRLEAFEMVSFYAFFLFVAFKFIVFYVLVDSVRHDNSTNKVVATSSSTTVTSLVSQGGVKGSDSEVVCVSKKRGLMSRWCCNKPANRNQIVTKSLPRSISVGDRGSRKWRGFEPVESDISSMMEFQPLRKNSSPLHPGTFKYSHCRQIEL